MNPIPLSAPDGRVFAYACGRCHHIPSMGAKLVVDKSFPDSEDLEWRYADTLRCCTCRTCGCPQADDRRIGECERCRLWTIFRHQWVTVVECAENGLTSRDDYKRWWQKTYEEDSDD